MVADFGIALAVIDPFERDLKIGVCDGGTNPFAPLFHRSVRQSHSGERGDAVRNVGFDIHQIGVDPQHRGGVRPGEHGEDGRAEGC